MPDFLRYGRRATRLQAALGHRAGGPAAPGRKANDGMVAGWQSRGLGVARLRALKRRGHGLFGNLVQAMSLAASGLLTPAPLRHRTIASGRWSTLVHPPPFFFFAGCAVSAAEEPPSLAPKTAYTESN